MTNWKCLNAVNGIWPIWLRLSWYGLKAPCPLGMDNSGFFKMGLDRWLRLCSRFLYILHQLLRKRPSPDDPKGWVLEIDANAISLDKSSSCSYCIHIAMLTTPEHQKTGIKSPGQESFSGAVGIYVFASYSDRQSNAEAHTSLQGGRRQWLLLQKVTIAQPVWFPPVFLRHVQNISTRTMFLTAMLFSRDESHQGLSKKPRS